jgi:hypothetical protein
MLCTRILPQNELKLRTQNRAPGPIIMKLNLNSLQPDISEVLFARLWSLRANHHSNPEDAGARAVIMRRWKGLGWRILGAAAVGGAVVGSITALSGAHTAAIGGLTFMGAYLTAIGTGVASMAGTKSGKNAIVTAEELRALATGVKLGGPEMIYLDTICAMLEAGDNISDATGQEILSTLSMLLEQSRYINDRRERLRKAAGAKSVGEILEERNRLSDRITRAEDPQARTDLTQSLAMCEDRLKHARELSPLLERLDAQWEVIEQTFLSVQASVSRLQAAPQALAAPDVEEVKRVVVNITAQTRAVEDAVQQVMSLRS